MEVEGLGRRHLLVGLLSFLSRPSSVGALLRLSPPPPPPPPAWPPCVHHGGRRGRGPLFVFVETAGGRNVVLGWPSWRVTHSESFETSLHLRRLQRRGGEVVLFTEGLWLRGWSCCGQRGWPSQGPSGVCVDEKLLCLGP